MLSVCKVWYWGNGRLFCCCVMVLVINVWYSVLDLVCWWWRFICLICFVRLVCVVVLSWWSDFFFSCVWFGGCVFLIRRGIVVLLVVCCFCVGCVGVCGGVWRKNWEIFRVGLIGIRLGCWYWWSVIFFNFCCLLLVVILWFLVGFGWNLGFSVVFLVLVLVCWVMYRICGWSCWLFVGWGNSCWVLVFVGFLMVDRICGGCWLGWRCYWWMVMFCCYCFFGFGDGCLVCFLFWLCGCLRVLDDFG